MHGYIGLSWFHLDFRVKKRLGTHLDSRMV